MLTRLEIIGFKSFAEKTRFDFARGITAIVGPNGSGKSNVVDAVKWVLGEQSAKSLRGGEMADVIFNGSSSRKSLGMAEVTMTFDNTHRLLAYDGPEVQITRRVYRDGQGEYLINGQLSRLKDIKEMFLGSGAGHGAYSIIEQGRVDAMLTASTKDRRTIFEEAAGISRFKAKKLETLRKLEHVEADLVRVRDILSELEKQLRTLRLQASKAQRYQEYTTRLKLLRVALGQREYTELVEMITREEDILSRLRAELAEAEAKAETGEAELGRINRELGVVDDSIRYQDTKLGEARQQIAAQESTARAERGQLASYEAEELRLGKQLADVQARLSALTQDLAKTQTDKTKLEGVVATAQAAAHSAAMAATAAIERITDLTRLAQADRERQFELVGRAARLHSDAESSAALLDRQKRDLTRKQAEAQTLAAKHDALEKALAQLSRTDADVRERINHVRATMADHVKQRAEALSQSDAIQTELDKLRQKQSSLATRIDVLEGLEKNYEGFGAGVKAVAEQLSGSQNMALAKVGVLGLVADCLSVPPEYAPLVDWALGEAVQRVVLKDDTVLEKVTATLGELPGRVTFLPINSHLHVRLAHSLAQHVVTTPPELADQILGRVVLVDSLEAAKEALTTGGAIRAITRDGIVMDADGAVTLGPAHAAAAIVSRKSELRELTANLLELERTLKSYETEQAGYRRAAESLEQPIQLFEQEIQGLSGEAGSLRDRMTEQRQAQKQLAETIEITIRESDLAAAEIQAHETAWKDLRAQADQAERDAATVQTALKELDEALILATKERDGKQAESTTAQVALGRANEQWAALTARETDLENTLKQRKIDVMNLISSERTAKAKVQEASLNTLNATAVAALAYTAKGEYEQQLIFLHTQREELRLERDRVQSELKVSRTLRQERQDRAHARELTARDLVNRRESLVTRLKDDYGVDLTVQQIPTTAEQDTTPHGSEDAQDEIEYLRRKIAKLGSVNLEALDELADVEKRESELRVQHDDLATAATKLTDIILQINGDSRKLFLETLAAVRVHFQELFRKLFGGGMADVILEDEADPLESGIEVTARPPGKELRSISLLSGGEKTMTAVALLLAIFRNRPSPFCILDEVDAALDEANTTRFAGVIKDFLDRSQFIVVTHKKRTMASADVLYGVTMQESGVSKQIAVKFEDWPDDDAKAARQGAA